MELRIDTDDVRTTHEGIVNDKASEFVADLEDSLDGLSRTEQIQLFDRLSAIVGNKDAFSAFVNGTYAQDSTGSPAKALGAGSSAPSEEDARKALATILGAPSMPNGFKHLLRRAYDETAPDHIKTEDDGTPIEVIGLRKQVTDLTSAKTEVETKLADANNESKPGSLAKQLKEAKAGATGVDKDELKKFIPVLDKLANGKASKLTAADLVVPKTSAKEVKDTVDGIKALVS